MKTKTYLIEYTIPGGARGSHICKGRTKVALLIAHILLQEYNPLKIVIIEK